MLKRKTWICGLALFAAGTVSGMWLVANEDRVSSVTSEVRSTFGVHAAYAKEKRTPKISPVKARPRDVYFPNTEDLAKDEMRVIACGTGMPTTRAAQAAACFLVELGNGDKFIFDAGSGLTGRGS
jgi:ribonuclease Z